jgi:RimJ/RimL family protein N-acetyltransferase
MKAKTVLLRSGEDLVSRRLRLRCPVEDDASAVIAIAGDWQVARRLGRMPHPYTADDFRFFIERIVPTEHTWAIIVRQTGQLVGVIGLVPDDDSKSAELGYYLGRPHWGQGLATEAAQLVVHYSREAKVYARLTSRHHVDNPASGRVLAKLGFRQVGYSDQPCLAERKDKPSIDVELLF